MSYLSEVLADSPIFVGLLDETSGTSAADSSGNGHTGTYFNSPTLATAGLLTDGGTSITTTSTAFVEFPFGTVSASPFSVEDWYKYTSSSTPLIPWRDATGSNGWFLRLDQTNIAVRVSGTDRTTSTLSSTVKDGNRHQFVLTVDGTTNKLYVDGSQVDSWSQSPATAPLSPLKVGKNGTAAQYSPGIYDAVSVYASALSAARVLAHYNAGIAVTVAAPLVTLTIDTLTPSIPAVIAAPLVTMTLDTLTPGVRVGAPTLSLTLDTLAPLIMAPPVTPPLTTLTLDALTPGVVVGAPLLTLTMDTRDPLVVGVFISAPLLTLTFDTHAPGIITTPLSLSFTAAPSLSFAADGATPLSLSFAAAPSLRIALARPSTIDPVTGLPQYRLLAVTPDGTVLGELPKAAIGDHVLGLGLGDESLTFSLPKYDAGSQHVLPAYGKIIPEVQLWRGPNLEAWLRVDGEPGNNDGTLTYDCSGLGEHLKGRLVGKAPKTNWLINGDFSNGFYGWSFDYDPGSVPAVAPVHSIVDVDFFGKDAKALQLGGATTYTKSAVKTATVFVPNTATYASGGEAKIEAAGANIPDGSDVHVIGHTAYNYIDGDYGNGLALSLDRAQAVKATLHAQNSTLTFSLPPGWDDIDPAKRADDGTVGGRGRYVPVASNDTYAGQAENRRVELQYVATIDANAGQFARAALTVGEITIPYGERALPVTFKGWASAAGDIVKTSGGYGVLVTLYDVSGSTLVKVDEAYSTLDESSSRTLWEPHEGTVTIPANNRPHRLGVRFYAPGGYVLWTAGGVYPEEALFFNKVDQALIVQGLVEHAQDPAMDKLGDVPILIGTRTFETGRTRTKTYPYHERRQIFDAISEFEALHNGMDLSLEITPTERVVATHYPRRGQGSGVTFELGSNIIDFTPPTDVTSSGTRWIAQALESSGADREEGIVTDLTGMGGMLIERLAYAEPDTPVTELESAAESSSKRYGHPVTMLTVTVGRVGAWDPALTSWMLDHVKVGDLVDVVINDGPYQIYGKHRVTKRTLTPDTDTLRYQLAPEV